MSCTAVWTVLPLRQRAGTRYVWLDAADVALVARTRWTTLRRRRTRYLQAKVRDRFVLMHRLILGLATGDPAVDHINGDGLDNRRCNLRAATTAENGQNRIGLDSRNSSGYRGVSFYRRTGRWQAYAKVNQEVKSLGYFDTAEEAGQVASAYRRTRMPFSEMDRA